MKITRSHLIRLHPTPEQETYFRKACGVARHAYNWALARWKEARATGERVKINDLKREYNQIKGEQFPWAYEVTKCAPEQAFTDLGQAFDNYWRLSDGTVFENQRHYRQSLGRLKGLSKGLSRKVEGSQNWRKNTKKLAKAHCRVANQRQDSLQKMTTHVTRTYALIGLEDLNAKGMLANHKLAQAVSDASFFEVKRQLLYKSEQSGGYVQLVDRWYPSSKTCSACGWIDEDLKLSDRVFICEGCGLSIDRDFNAAVNIRNEALRLMTDVPVVASSARKFACGAGSPGSFGSETFCEEAGTGKW
jgi:IS605 OrfB family transposase